MVETSKIWVVDNSYIMGIAFLYIISYYRCSIVDVTVQKLNNINGGYMQEVKEFIKCSLTLVAIWVVICLACNL